MAGGKETPRQKMIGMMYLVLTALLALNVSKEIINAFVVMNTGLEETNRNSQQKNGILYSAFEAALANDEKKTRPYYDKANAIQKASDDLVTYIQLLKADIKMNAQSLPDQKTADTFQLKNIDKLDDYDTPTYYMIGEDPANVTGKAAELKTKIETYKKLVLGFLSEKEKANFNIGMNLGEKFNQSEEKMVSWEWYNFYNLPVAATIANLTKMQNDVRNVEGDAVNLLFKNISAADFKFDTLAARVVASSNYVLIGDEYKADVFVAAFSTTSNPVIVLGDVDSITGKMSGPQDSTTVKVDRGVGVYKISPTAEGEVKWSGLIKVKKPDGSWAAYPFKSSFIAARPAAVVSPTKMNVFYIGVDNPVEISVPGVPAEKIQPSMSGGSLSGGKGKYTVRVTKAGESTINVSANLGGKNTSMGTFKFRVKPVPDPVTSFAGKKASDPNLTITKSALVATGFVFAEMVGFDFDLKFNVVSFDISMTVNGIEVTEKSMSGSLTGAQKTILGKAKTGGKVYIENVKVKGPDGTVRTIPGFSLKVIG
jgi:gliding motility-associated protein GldM